MNAGRSLTAVNIWGAAGALLVCKYASAYPIKHIALAHSCSAQGEGDINTCPFDRSVNDDIVRVEAPPRDDGRSE